MGVGEGGESPLTVVILGFVIGDQEVRPTSRYSNYPYGGDLDVVVAIPEGEGAAGQSTRPRGVGCPALPLCSGLATLGPSDQALRSGGA